MMRHLPEMLGVAAEVALARLGRRIVMRPLTRLPSSIRTPEGRYSQWSSVFAGDLRRDHQTRSLQIAYPRLQYISPHASCRP